MAKKHLEQYDKDGNRLDIYLNDDEVMVGDQTLADKLDDMDEAIEDAGDSGYTPPEGGIPKTDLAQSVQETLNAVSSKANSSEVVKSISVNGTPQTKTDGVVNIEVPTMTDISDAFDDAISEAQVSVVPEGDVGFIDGLGSDSTTDGLTAHMGKVIKAALLTLWGSLGNYCFPAGRPTLVLDGSSTVSFSVTYTNTDQHVEFDDGEGEEAPDSVEMLGSITVHLSTDDNLYIINEDSVHAYVNGVEVSGAYDPTTDTITVNNVTGNVVIIAQAMTYVQDGLVLHLDGKNRGGVSGHWKSLVDYNGSPIDFTLKSGVTAADTGMVFDGGTNAYADTDTQLNVLATAGTIEAVAAGLNDSFNTILVNPIENAIGLSIHNVSNDSSHKNAVIMMGRASSNYNEQSAKWSCRVGDTTTDFAIAVTAGTPNGVGHNKGDALTVGEKFHLVVDPTYHNKLAIGCRLRASSSNYLNGTIKAIRVYSSHLTADQQLQNWFVDKKRFNL